MGRQCNTPLPSRERLIVIFLPSLLNRDSPEAQIKVVLENDRDGRSVWILTKCEG